MKVFIFLLVVLFSFGCATTQIDNFEKIKTGMDKDDVLSLIGSPKRTERATGIEKWSYTYYTGDDEKIETFKFVKFANGKVTEFGYDTEEQERLEDLKKSALKKDALRKKKNQINKKLNEAYKKE
ncbi:MAG: outer membrane protein assembly factor BamE [Oligoflexia bacterium]|nr:outer membrane protein assembly factor BamE [Oligoflexia bacterium]